MAIFREIFDKFEQSQKVAAKSIVEEVLREINRHFPEFHSVSYRYESSYLIVMSQVNGIECYEPLNRNQELSDDLKSMLVEMNLKLDELYNIRWILAADEFKEEVMKTQYGRRADAGDVIELSVHNLMAS